MSSFVCAMIHAVFHAKSVQIGAYRTCTYILSIRHIQAPFWAFQGKKYPPESGEYNINKLHIQSLD